MGGPCCSLARDGRLRRTPGTASAARLAQRRGVGGYPSPLVLRSPSVPSWCAPPLADAEEEANAVALDEETASAGAPAASSASPTQVHGEKTSAAFHEPRCQDIYLRHPAHYVSWNYGELEKIAVC